MGPQRCEFLRALLTLMLNESLWRLWPVLCCPSGWPYKIIGPAFGMFVIFDLIVSAPLLNMSMTKNHGHLWCSECQFFLLNSIYIDFQWQKTIMYIGAFYANIVLIELYYVFSQISLPLEKRRNATSLYNPMTVAELQQKFPKWVIIWLKGFHLIQKSFRSFELLNPAVS